jgi:glyceraldehyde-3-phosphate dehydrogenase (NAD(P))
MRHSSTFTVDLEALAGTASVRCGKERFMNQKVRVGINGYGVIGKRVADAVALQDDMELVGVTYHHLDYRIRVAAEKGYPIFSSSSERPTACEAGVTIRGNLDDLVKGVDVMVECSARGVGAANKPLYQKAGIKAVFQGGEEHELAGVSFTAQANYAEALNKQFVRVVSCNTTGLCRVMNALNKRNWIKKARAVLIRRGTDPWESHKAGLINTVVPETNVPSHQGPDARTIIAGLDITTMAATASHNLSHIHYVMVETTRPISLNEARQALWEEPRIAFVNSNNGLVALNSVIELMRDLGRPRNDLWEVALWEDALAVDDHEIYMVYQVHNEAITIPETIDAIRAMTGIETNAMKSIEKTNRSMGIVKCFLPKTMPEESEHEALNKAIEATRKGFGVWNENGHPPAITKMADSHQ